MPPREWICCLGWAAALAFSALAGEAPAPAGNLSPQNAAKAMTVPRGFNVTLFAGEPDVVQPVAFTFDDRGRLWVCEILSYPAWKPEGGDRISIYDDTDGDGKFDTKKVFWDKGNYLTGIEIGFGGVWVCSAPNFYFIPDKNGDDVPDGEPVALLDGWSTKGIHNVINSLTWGPDGWLYGCNGITAPSKVGKPGTPEAQRIAINCGVWRYHPTRHEFEIVAHGTTNPFGLDFNENGDLFATNCVIGHLWHIFPGANYQRMFGNPVNPHHYGFIDQCADHLHWAGGEWTSSRGGKGKHSDAGGGHSHVGCMVYLGDNWPDQYHGSVFTVNLHGNRINNDILEPKGSGYNAKHGADFLMANDSWFRGVAIKYGPDGGVYVTDWHDTGECHNYKVVDRSNGRIFKITHGQTKPQKIDLAKLSDDELVALHTHKNDWFPRHARRLLQERASAGTLKPQTAVALSELLAKAASAPVKLRALHTLYVSGNLDASKLVARLGQTDVPESTLAWTVRLLFEEKSLTTDALAALLKRAQETKSQPVRLALASGLQRLSLDKRGDMLAALLQHTNDAGDQNLPLMYWYALEPMVAVNAKRALDLAAQSKNTLLIQYTARRMGAEGLPAMVDLLQQSADNDVQRAVLRGMSDMLKGRNDIAVPPAWSAYSVKSAAGGDVEIRGLSQSISAAFGDAGSIDALKAILANTKAPLKDRREALDALLDAKAPKLVPVVQQLLGDADLRGRALSALGLFDDAHTPKLILAIYPKLDINEKRDALSTLSARLEYAKVLLDALQKKTIPSSDLNAFLVRQLESLTFHDMNEWIKTHWGQSRPTADDKLKEIAEYKGHIAAAKPGEADAARGRAVFKRTCAQCHKLFDDGGNVGPDLTGSGRADVDYLLQNMVDPNAITPKDYQVWLIKTINGQVISALLKSQDAQTVKIQTQTETMVLPRSQLKSMKQTDLSMMPEGLLTGMSKRDLLDLIGYMRNPSQVPLPAGK